MIETVPSCELAAQTSLPSGDTSKPSGPFPTVTWVALQPPPPSGPKRGGPPNPPPGPGGPPGPACPFGPRGGGPLSLGAPGGGPPAETPSTALLVLNKGDNTLAIVEPVAAKVIVRLPSGPDPHEVVGSRGLAFISNYGGNNTLSVVDLVAQKALAPINLGALRSPHGLWVAEGKVYFTAEANKIIGRYDPAAQQIDWLLGLGQKRTHMIVVSQDAKRIYTSNVNSDTISLVERGSGPGRPERGAGPSGPPGDGGPGGPRSDGPPAAEQAATPKQEARTI